jgi:hypothetical protein
MVNASLIAESGDGVMPRRKPSAGSVPGFHNAYAIPNGAWRSRAAPNASTLERTEGFPPLGWPRIPASTFPLLLATGVARKSQQRNPGRCYRQPLPCMG